MADQQNKADPVGDRYFRPLRAAEMSVDALFYVSALFSLAALFVEKPPHPDLYSLVQIGFIVSVVVLFVANLVIRLYFSPRAQKKRYEDFLAHAFATPLAHHQTDRYYNNSATTVPERIAAQVLENSFYSKDTASGMAVEERIKLAAHGLFWFICVINRSTEFTLIGVVAQIIFSEQLISRWIRLEWLRLKCEAIFEEVYSLLRTKANLFLPLRSWENTKWSRRPRR